jgi:prepilin-type N-terminal cleavage/methylation domain-containing protein
MPLFCDILFSMKQDLFTHDPKKGFTLIELIILASIIGILASAVLFSFSAAQKAGRDARRITDLQQVQQALQLYYFKCGIYPGLANCSGGNLFPGTNPPPITYNPAPKNWDELQFILKQARIGIDTLPFDPLEPVYNSSSLQNYQYFVQLGDVGQSGTQQGLYGKDTPLAQCYILSARLETNHRSLRDDLDTQHLLDLLIPTGNKSLSSKSLYPPVKTSPPVAQIVNCDDSLEPWMYCVGNSECFHD